MFRSCRKSVDESQLSSVAAATATRVTVPRLADGNPEDGAAECHLTGARITVEPLRIVIADDEPIIRLDLRRTLENMGHIVIGEAGDGAQAVEITRELKPDVAILDIKMPNMDGIDAAKVISTEGIAPVLLLTAYSQKDLVERARDAGVFAYLVKPFKEADLMPAIEIAIARYEEFLEMEKEVTDLENKLETRKAVDRAKGILMDQYGLKEQDAFRRIQVQSMNTRKSMREIAEAIIIANSV
ncbi:MAG: response regulator [Cytophagales bacterium]|nr:response regulator [Armatimonadota bacterium]